MESLPRGCWKRKGGKECFRVVVRGSGESTTESCHPVSGRVHYFSLRKVQCDLVYNWTIYYVLRKGGLQGWGTWSMVQNQCQSRRVLPCCEKDLEMRNSHVNHRREPMRRCWHRRKMEWRSWSTLDRRWWRLFANRCESSRRGSRACTCCWWFQEATFPPKTFCILFPSMIHTSFRSYVDCVFQLEAVVVFDINAHHSITVRTGKVCTAQRHILWVIVPSLVHKRCQFRETVKQGHHWKGCAFSDIPQTNGTISASLFVIERKWSYREKEIGIVAKGAKRLDSSGMSFQRLLMSSKMWTNGINFPFQTV